MNNLTDQHGNSLLQNLEALLWRSSEIRTFIAIVALFLDTSVKTTLQNIKTISASTASRFLNFDLTSRESVLGRAERVAVQAVLRALPPVCDKDFLSAALRLGFKKVIVGIRHNRVLTDGRQLHDLKHRGEAVRLHDLSALQL